MRSHPFRNELEEEEVFEATLVEEAKRQFTLASDMLTSVIYEEESRLKEQMPDSWKDHPLIVTLWRQV